MSRQKYPAEVRQNSNPQQQNNNVVLRQFSQVQISSPFPPAEYLAEAEKVYPGSAERIFNFIETEQARRHVETSKMNDARIEEFKADRLEKRRGQFFAFGLGLVGLVCATLIAIYCQSSGPAIAASAFGTGTIGALVYAFLRIPQPQRTEQPDQQQAK